MKTLKEQGAKVVGIFCSFVPIVPQARCPWACAPSSMSPSPPPRLTCPCFCFSDLVMGETACDGIRDKVELVDESNPDVYEALAIKYLNINCSVMSPNQSRMDYIAQMVEEFRIDGVIEIVLQSCHTYDVEVCYVKKLVTEKLD